MHKKSPVNESKREYNGYGACLASNGPDRFQALHMVTWTLSGMIPVHRFRNKPWVQRTFVPGIPDSGSYGKYSYVIPSPKSLSILSRRREKAYILSVYDSLSPHIY